MSKADHERIWLDATCTDCMERSIFQERCWAADKAQDNCPVCGSEPTEYIRADLVNPVRDAAEDASSDEGEKDQAQARNP